MPGSGWLRQLRPDRASSKRHRDRVAHSRSPAARIRRRAFVPVPGPGRAIRIRGIPSGTTGLILGLASTIGRLWGPAGLKPADLPGAVAGHGGDHLATLIEDCSRNLTCGPGSRRAAYLSSLLPAV